MTVPDPAYIAPAMPWWTDLLIFTPVVGAVAVIWWIWSQGGGVSFIKKQSDYLDFQRSANERALEQSKTAIEQNRAFEAAVERQYQENNDRADRALAQSEEALRLHADALDQLKRMNETLARLATSLEGERPARA